jgi:hypothetical protein
MLKKVFRCRELLNHLIDILWPNLSSEEIPQSAGLWPLFIQINQDLKTGSGKGVNRNRITVHEINADRSFNLSAHSFQFRDFDFAAIHFRGAIASAISLGWFNEYVI